MRLCLLSVLLVMTPLTSLAHTISYDSNSTSIAASVAEHIKALVGRHSYHKKYVITANKYFPGNEESIGWPRRYSTVRALKIRSLLVHYGVPLANIRIVIVTDSALQNDAITISTE